MLISLLVFKEGGLSGGLMNGFLSDVEGCVIRLEKVWLGWGVGFVVFCVRMGLVLGGLSLYGLELVIVVSDGLCVCLSCCYFGGFFFFLLMLCEGLVLRCSMILLIFLNVGE